MKEPRIIRVFPRRTKATPADGMAFIGDPPLRRPEADEVHISVTFTWDLDEAWRLENAWRQYYPFVKVGGPALSPAGDFEPGRYLAEGYVITTRGCPNHCSFCFVPEREGRLRRLPIRDGYDVLDNNLLAAGRGHIEQVLDMLARQRQRARFSGGLEARRVEPWFARGLQEIRPAAGFVAYDRPADRKPLQQAAELLRPCFTSRRLGCYLLCGYEGDTLEAAKERCQFAADLGLRPFPMYYRGRDWSAHVPPDWAAWIWPRARGLPDRPDSHGKDARQAELFR
jgi:hypothetical protein